ncbi:MAG: TRAP transporter small permease [Pseudomonadota bacterium]|nr:TRAP transporter small permease [Pseudomonadota bacterium]
MHHKARTPAGRAVNAVEETLIAAILGAMTLVTFANVIARYVFNSNILWALEVTSFLFAWLVLLGASYCVKTTAHLGVDAVLNVVSPGLRRALGLISAAVCLAFALLLLKGAWDFWAPYGEMQPTSGRWFPDGFAKARGQGWYELNDVPMPGFLNQLFADTFNEGERYEKLPRLIPYFVLPLSMLLLVLRFAEAGWEMIAGTRASLIASHEVEEEVEAAAQAHRDAAREGN